MARPEPVIVLDSALPAGHHSVALRHDGMAYVPRQPGIGAELPVPELHYGYHVGIEATAAYPQ